VKHPVYVANKSGDLDGHSMQPA
jgi:hypothetical protein